MPKKEQVTMSSITSGSSIDPQEWLYLKREYDQATKNKRKEDKLELEREKKNFAEMWVAAGLDLKETLMENHISSCKKKN